MSTLLKKLHFKPHLRLVVINLVEDIRSEFVQAVEHQHFFEKVEDISSFVLVFVMDVVQLNAIIPDVIDKLSEDALFWIAYPKKSSKRYKSNIDRDHGWGILGQYGFEPVSQVSLNDDFSVLRFRHIRHIKVMTRPDEAKLSR